MPAHQVTIQPAVEDDKAIRLTVLQRAATAIAGSSAPQPETAEQQWGVIGGATGIASLGLTVGSVYGGKVGAAIGTMAGFAAARGLIRWPSAREAIFRFLGR